MRIGVDTGGTFTDFVWVDGKKIRSLKVSSTREDPSKAILGGLERLPPLPADTVMIHGSTVATNALLERKLARVTFITNEGLTDILEIGRQARPELYALEITKPEPLVPSSRRLPVRERRDASGKLLEEPTQRELSQLLKKVKRSKPEAVAIGLLYSFLDGRTERKIATALKSLGLSISLSSDVAPEIREFERFSTTVANAALMPIVSKYLSRLEKQLSHVPLFVFQSNGGMMRGRSASKYPVRLVLSGPAGGVVAAARVAKQAGIGNALTLDMGGTSSDVAGIEGEALRRGEIEFDGHPLQVPSLDIQSVGAGGGSIAWLDSGGMLRVGPRSAGANPGPACYGKSDLPTVTDAHVVLGRLPTHLAGGNLQLDHDRSHRAMERLGKEMSMNRRRAAEGVLAVADATMARAVRGVSTARGQDPRHLPLIAFGGAGPLHAARLCRALPCKFAIVPPLPGNFSAYGMALAIAERDLVRSILIRDPDRNRARVERAVQKLVQQGRQELKREGFLQDSEDRLDVEIQLDCRYTGQTFTLEVPLSRSIRASFDRAHQSRFGYHLEEHEVEAVHARVRLAVPSGDRRGSRKRKTPQIRKPVAIGTRSVWFDGRVKETPILLRESLVPGHRLSGPAVIEEEGATTIVEPDFRFTVDREGNLILEPTRRL